MDSHTDDTLAPLPSDELQLLFDEPLSLELRDDRKQLVPRIPQQAFVTLARQLRDEGRLELVLPEAIPGQLTAVFDLDVWTGDRIQVPRVREWLTQIVEAYRGARTARGDLVRLMYAMDPEMWTFAVLHGTSVLPLDPDDDERREQARAAVSDLTTFETPDSLYLIAVPNHELGRQAITIIEAVYHDSLEDGRRLVNSLRGGLASQLEEDLLRWRRGRLADLGFVEWEEAMRLFTPLPVDAAPDVEHRTFADVETTAIELAGWGHKNLLRQVLEHLDPGQHGVRTREFTLLVNEVMAAQRFEPGDTGHQQRAIHQAQATVSLALEMLAGGRDPQDITGELSQHLTRLGLRNLFRLGYRALDKLRRAALSLHREGRVSLSLVGSLLDRPWNFAVAALAGWYPELVQDAQPQKTRPIANLRDVARATQLIEQAAALSRLTFDRSGFGIDPVWVTRVDEPGRLTLGDLVRTAAICRELPGHTQSVALTPLTQDDLSWARDNLLLAPDNRLDPRLAEHMQARLRDLGLEQHAPTLTEGLLTRLAVELAALEPDQQGRPDLTKTGGVVTIQSVGVWLRTGLTGN